MSADNWAVCPKCKQAAKEEYNALTEQVEKSYGSVSYEEDMKLFKKAQETPIMKSSLREKYELGIKENGQFYIGYDASCQDCGFEFAFQYTEQVLKQ